MFANRRLSFPGLMAPQTISYVKEGSKSPKKINQYRLIQKIGTGTSSKVFLAEDEKTGGLYAAKVFRNNKGCPFSEPFQREVINMRELKHKGIVQLHEALYSSSDDIAAMILDYADLGSLDSVLKKYKTLSEKQIATIFSHIVCATHYLHERGIVHHDIKPSNILIFSDGSAKLTDFGIGHSFSSADCVSGSPAYQAPELFEDFDPETEPPTLDPIKGEVWSIGVSMFESFYGFLPFNGSNQYQIAKDAKERKLIFGNEITPIFSNLLDSMLNPDPEKRFSIIDTMNHPFFSKGRQEILDIPKPSIPIYDSNESSVLEIKAENCTNEISRILSPKIIRIPPRSLSNS